MLILLKSGVLFQIKFLKVHIVATVWLLFVAIVATNVYCEELKEGYKY